MGQTSYYQYTLFIQKAIKNDIIKVIPYLVGKLIQQQTSPPRNLQVANHDIIKKYFHFKRQYKTILMSQAATHQVPKLMTMMVTT
jgi:hypothetical protein